MLYSCYDMLWKCSQDSSTQDQDQDQDLELQDQDQDSEVEDQYQDLDLQDQNQDQDFNIRVSKRLETKSQVSRTTSLENV